MLTKLDVLHVLADNGAEQAYNVLLLAGPDGFEGSLDKYNELIGTLQTQVVIAKSKLALFEKALELYKLAEEKTYDGRDYFEQSEGAYQMLKVLGIEKEYIKWSIGK